MRSARTIFFGSLVVMAVLFGIGANRYAALDEVVVSRAATQEFGVQTDLFRPPGGAYGEVLVEGAKERGYHIILWDVDPRDWQVPSDDTIAERIMAEVRPGSIILLHDGQYPIHSADALRKVADRLKADGYSFVTVSEMMGMSAGGAE